MFLHEPVKYLMDMSDRPSIRHVLIWQVFSPVRHLWQPCSVQLQSHKWWHRVLLYVVDGSMMNSWVLYQDDCRHLGLAMKTRACFYKTLALDMIQPSVRAGRVATRGRNLQPRGALHRPEGHPVSGRNCILCHQRTRKFCGGCNGAFMCSPGCYVRIYTQLAFATRVFGRWCTVMCLRRGRSNGERTGWRMGCAND
jgi:hypothetical protein